MSIVPLAARRASPQPIIVASKSTKPKSSTGDAARRAWPRHEPVLTLAERREMQELLNRKGFDTGEPNGRLGAKARAAVRDYQASVGLVPDGFASATILARLRR